MKVGTKAAKEKVTVSVDQDLLQMVDAYVDESKDAGMSRSAVFEQALHLWKQAQRDRFDAAYYAENAEALKDDQWSSFTTEAAKHIWQG